MMSAPNKKSGKVEKSAAVSPSVDPVTPKSKDRKHSATPPESKEAKLRRISPVSPNGVKAEEEH